MSVKELTQVGSLRRKLGHEVRVSVAEASASGNPEPSVDVREWITPEAYPATDTTPAATATRRRMSGKGSKVTRAHGYTGPTRSGLWLSIAQAVELAELLVRAAQTAEDFTGGGS